MAVCERVTCEHMEVQYHIHNSLPPVPIMSQLNLRGLSQKYPAN